MATPTLQLSEFLPLVLPHAQGVSEPMATFNLRLAAIEFCERTRAWRHVINTTVTAQNKTLVAPEYAAIHEIEEAYFDGAKLTPVQYTEINHGDETDNTGTPCYITQQSPNTVALYPFGTGALKMSVFLKPRGGHEYGNNPDNPLEDAFDEVPEFLFVQHGELIAFGALHRILMTPNKAYSNPDASAYYYQRFEAGVNGLKSTNMRGQQRAPRRTRSQPF